MDGVFEEAPESPSNNSEKDALDNEKDDSEVELENKRKKTSDQEDENSDDDDDGEKKNSTDELKKTNTKSILSDEENASGDEDEESDIEIKKKAKKKRKIILSDEEDDSDNQKEESDTENKKENKNKTKTKRKKIISDDEDENSDDDDDDDDEDVEDEKEDSEQDKGDSEDNESKQKDKKESSDDEVENSDDDDDDRREKREPSNNTLYDFDIMMAKKKEENSRKRRRRNYDIINDNDDIIADIINQMKEAYETDIEANKNKQAATKKLKLLPFVISQLRKVDLKDAFLDSDVLSVITEWLAPLPDKSLPHLNIRESFLKLLIEFNLYDVDRIKSSGIGKAIMYLFKHPKETKENKQRAKQLISSWSRPIFNLDSSFTSISREEREQRDLELMNKKRRTSKNNDDSDEEGAGTSGINKQKSNSSEPVAKKPGDKGWIPRARVPAPSMRDYVIRPQSKVDGDVGKSSRRPSNMLEKYMKNQQDLRRANRVQRAVNMKIDKG